MVEKYGIELLMLCLGFDVCQSTALHWHTHTPVKLETLMSKLL